MSGDYNSPCNINLLSASRTSIWIHGFLGAQRADLDPSISTEDWANQHQGPPREVFNLVMSTRLDNQLLACWSQGIREADVSGTAGEEDCTFTFSQRIPEDTIYLTLRVTSQESD
jgi:hypothetical protein